MKPKCFQLIATAATFTTLASAGETPWAQFRGPNCSGISNSGKPPVHFGAKSNVLWKTVIPAGVSSPCVAGGRIFVTSVDVGKLVTIGVDAGAGKVLWKQTAPATKIEDAHRMGSPASATPASDGERVYSYFGSYGVIAYDLNGKEQW